MFPAARLHRFVFLLDTVDYAVPLQTGEEGVARFVAVGAGFAVRGFEGAVGGGCRVCVRGGWGGGGGEEAHGVGRVAEGKNGCGGRSRCRGQESDVAEVVVNSSATAWCAMRVYTVLEPQELGGHFAVGQMASVRDDSCFLRRTDVNSEGIKQ